MKITVNDDNSIQLGYDVLPDAMQQFLNPIEINTPNAPECSIELNGNVICIIYGEIRAELNNGHIVVNSKGSRLICDDIDTEKTREGIIKKLSDQLKKEGFCCGEWEDTASCAFHFFVSSGLMKEPFHDVSRPIAEDLSPAWREFTDRLEAFEDLRRQIQNQNRKFRIGGIMTRNRALGPLEETGDSVLPGDKTLYGYSELWPEDPGTTLFNKRKTQKVSGLVQVESTRILPAITPGNKFCCLCLAGLITVINVHPGNDTLTVRIDPQTDGREPWIENTWSLKITLMGFENGEYWTVGPVTAGWRTEHILRKRQLQRAKNDE